MTLDPVYDLLRQSKLFDAAFYLAQNPDVASLGTDALDHYIRQGARLGRNPSKTFDSAFYLRQCLNRGEGIPDNPLHHFLTVGKARGLTPRRAAATQAASEPRVFRLHCDHLALTTNGALHASGWVIAPTGVEGIDVSLDTASAGAARLTARTDVAAHFSVSAARTAGFTLQAALGTLAAGRHAVTFALRDRDGAVELHTLQVEAADADAGDATDPLRRRLHIDTPPIVDGVARVSGNLSIGGWAVAQAGVDSVEVHVDGRLASRAHCGMRREDVAAAAPSMPDALLSGFATTISRWQLPDGESRVEIILRDKRGETEIRRFRLLVGELPDTGGPWLLRRKMSRAEIELHERTLARLSWRPHFTVVIAVGATPDERQAAERTLASLRAQAYGRWNAVVVNRDAATSTGPLATLAAPEATFIALLQAGDQLGCDALLESAVTSGLRPEGDLFYSDERRPSAVGRPADAFFKPAWSPHLLLSMNYVGRFWFARREVLARAAPTVRDWLDLGDYDTVLRATEAAARVEHIPAVLCERGGQRVDSTAQEQAALERALARRGINAVPEPGSSDGSWHIRRKLATRGKVSIVIPTCAEQGMVRRCIESLREKTAYRNFEVICVENIPAERAEWRDWLAANADKVVAAGNPFNWSRFNNLAAMQASGEFLLFLNDDVEITEPGWLDALLELAERPEVGVVGPQLLYADGTVQHAGIALISPSRGRHSFRTNPRDEPGYFGLAQVVRDVSAVTGACLLTRRETFHALGRFDEAHSIVNNDVDFCLRARERGFAVVFTPHASLIHHELVSRSKLPDSYNQEAFARKWSHLQFQADPFFNRNLSRDDDELRPELEPVQAICAGHPLFAKEEIRSILVVKLDHIGDCVLALPAIRRLRQDFPAARLTLLSAAAMHAVWALEPVIDEVIALEYFHTRSELGESGIADAELLTLREQLESRAFDLAVDLRKDPDTRHVLRYTGARWTAGFDQKGAFPWLDIALEWDQDMARVPKRQQVGDGLLNLAAAIANSTEPQRCVIEPGNIAALSLTPALERLFQKPVVCIQAGSGNEMRTWMPERFAELAGRILQRGDLHVALIGAPDEKALADAVAARIGDHAGLFNLAGTLKLHELPSLLARCRLFVGNNSGPGHVAAGLGIPTVGIYSGVADAREWGPLGPDAVAVRRDMSCSPCYLSRRDQCPRAMACLTGIGVADVYRQCERMLAGTR